MFHNYCSAAVFFVVTVVCAVAQGQCDMSDPTCGPGDSPMLSLDRLGAGSRCDMGDPTCGKKPLLPEDVLAAADPAFGRYVDFALLSRAWTELDASALTDVALQMVEGERVLMRPHKEFSAADLMELAARTATEKNDTPSLQRLAQVAKASQDHVLTQQLAMATKLGGPSRSADLFPKISIETEVKWCPKVYIGGREVPCVAPSVALFKRLLAASPGE